MFHITRVCTPSHNTPELGKDDLTSIIERGYFWKKSTTFDAPVGSLIIAMGSHGGRGLFLFGIVTGEWEDEPENGEYHKRIPVQWQQFFYEHHKSAVERVAAMVPDFNYRFGAINVSPRTFAEVFSYVVEGTMMRPDYHWYNKAA